jgi:hypothetical protein
VDIDTATAALSGRREPPAQQPVTLVSRKPNGELTMCQHDVVYRFRVGTANPVMAILAPACLCLGNLRESVMMGTTTVVMLIAATAIADNAYPPCTQQRTDNCTSTQQKLSPGPTLYIPCPKGQYCPQHDIPTHHKSQRSTS